MVARRADAPSDRVHPRESACHKRILCRRPRLYTVCSMPNAIRLLDRPNISDVVVEKLRELIVDGHLSGGERVNEVRLAAQLGVSRTPLREALGRLQAEGAIYTVPRLGFFVQALTLDEFRQIYPIRALLDPEALRLAGLPSDATLRSLAALNDRIRAERATLRVLELDDEWHMQLIEHCRNRVLVDLIRQFMRRTRRYEVALMRDGRNVSATTADHDCIMRALRERDLEGACAALRQNMTSGIGPIEQWLEQRNQRES